jgi:hypothetical protein
MIKYKKKVSYHQLLLLFTLELRSIRIKLTSDNVTFVEVELRIKENLINFEIEFEGEEKSNFVKLVSHSTENTSS